METVDFSLLELRKGDRLLDLGCGEGRHLVAACLNAEVDAIGIDLNLNDLKSAREKFEPFRKESKGMFAIASANALRLPFADNSFDKVVCSEVLEHIPDYEGVLAEIRRVLRPGGQLLLLEHVRGQTSLTRRLTDWLHPLWFALQGECHLNRETAATVAAAGFRVDATESHGRGLLQLIRATAPQ